MSEITYRKCGDYYLPNLILPKQETTFIGKYGLLRKSYLEKHRPIIYSSLLVSCKLHEHLLGIDRQSKERLSTIMRKMAQAQGITEALKATDQMAWVSAMNNIKACAEEIILKEIVYA